MELYQPQEDSNLIAESVPKLVKKGMKCLDMGTGSGIIVKALLEQTSNVTGADINPYAVNYCAKKFKKAKFIQSDLFSNITDKYDVITFNPPYLPEDKHEDLETALTTTGGAQGYELLLKFLAQAKSHLTKEGFIITLFSTLTKPDVVYKEAERLGYKHEEISNKKVFFETLYCVSFSLKKS